MADLNVKTRVDAFLAYLEEHYKDAACSLRHNNEYELLAATILSAQCTDERVNKVTPVLFRRYPDINAMASGDVSEISDIIKSTGFYNNKAVNLHQMAKSVLENYDGIIPMTIDELVKLPGVGRKTANVLIGNFSAAVGIVVDTHVKRISERLGFSVSKDPVKIEEDLTKLIPRDAWNQFSHRVISFGRDVCTARSPRCADCGFSGQCPYYDVKR